MVLAALPAAAGPDSDAAIKLLVNSTAEALRNHDAKQFLAAFDPGMKDYRELAANVRGLLRDADVAASIEILPDRMKWTLEIDAHDASAGATTRRIQAKYTTEENAGKLRIASFEPVSLFGAPHGREAWDAISAFARDLQGASDYADSNRATPLRSPVDLPSLLSRFDPAMPGYERLEADIKALTAAWLLEPALQLTGNEGDDDRRTLDIDWTMTLTDPQNSGTSVRKRETVKCVVEKRGKPWLIVSMAPLELFAPPK
jgi:hypothetical protein